VIRLRIVLAEDHPEMADELRTLLARAFDVVESVADGQALIDAVDAHHPDVILADISMPRCTGFAAASTILAKYPEARIVFVTVRDEPAVIRNAMSRGIAGFVLKCNAGAELLAAVHAVNAGDLYLSSGARAALLAATPKAPPQTG
jgi:DNA-binding NarL/FixJ family response regulator